MNILITGHTGFLGKNLISQLNKSGKYNIYGASRSIEAKLLCNQYVIDLTNKAELKRIINEKAIDIVYHLAGKAIVQDCDSDPFNAFQVNGLGTASIFEACRDTNVKKIISVETDKLYGFQEETPTNEDAILNPNSPYELSKVLASQFADFYREYYGMDIISVRPANLIGGDDPNTTRILPASFERISRGEGIPVYSTAVSMERDFVYVKDAARALIILAENNNNHSKYNISLNESIKILDFANKITNVLGHNIEPQIIQKKGDFKEIPLQSIDGSRFIEEYNFQYTPLDNVILESYKEYMDA